MKILGEIIFCKLSKFKFKYDSQSVTADKSYHFKSLFSLNWHSNHPKWLAWQFILTPELTIAPNKFRKSLGIRLQKKNKNSSIIPQKTFY